MEGCWRRRTDGGAYLYRDIQPRSNHLTSQLYAEDFSSTDPIAKFIRSNRRIAKPARLVLCARSLEVQDDVVMSFLFLEKSRRATDNSTQNKADVLGTPAVSIGATAIRNGGVS